MKKEIIIEKIHNFCFAETLEEKKKLKTELDSIIQKMELSTALKKIFQNDYIRSYSNFQNRQS